MKKLIYMADGLFHYKDGDIHTAEDEEGYVLKQAKTSRTIEKFIQFVLKIRRGE
jgi:hypothetical protein